MAKKMTEIEAGSIDPSGRYKTYDQDIANIAKNLGNGEEKIYEGGTLEEFTIKAEGPQTIKSKEAVKLPLEGNYPTMSGAHLAHAGYKGLSGSTDYYYRGSQDKPEVIGEVDIEGGKVTGVYGDDPSFYGSEKKHQREIPKYKSKKAIKKIIKSGKKGS